MALEIKRAEEQINAAVLKALSQAGLFVEAEAKKNCPVDTGNLRASITTQLAPEEQAVYVGTNVEYAPFVEYGTTRQKAQPYLNPALNENISTIESMFEGII